MTFASPNAWRSARGRPPAVSIHHTGHIPNYDFVLDQNGKLHDLRPWRRPNSTARGLPQAIPPTFTQPRKENMTQQYTDQQLKYALNKAAGEREDIDIQSLGASAWLETELNDLRAILDNLPKTDDELTPCTHDEIQKGDTVEWTRKDRDLTRVVTGIAHLKAWGAWYTACGEILAPDNRGGTYRRKPAPVITPDPETHEFIFDDDDGTVWRANSSNSHYARHGLNRHPGSFGKDWSPAKVVKA